MKKKPPTKNQVQIAMAMKINHKKLTISLILLAIIGLSSCSDSGCIEADDFGEYQSQTLIVPSNGVDNICKYDYQKDLLDPSQGSGLKDCLTSGTVSYTVGTETIESKIGCKRYVDNNNYLSLCVEYCINKCLANSQLDKEATVEPRWTSTSRKTSGTNIGVTISPSSEIVIKAKGSLILGDKTSYPNFYVYASQYLPHTLGNTLSDQVFFDVMQGQAISVSFSGQAIDKSNGTNDGNISDEIIGGGATALSTNPSTANDASIFNAAKRTIAYLIPSPKGYLFDNTKTNEEQRSIGVPLLPDARAWNCTYTGVDLLESNCTNKSNGYSSIYPKADDALSIAAFPISSQNKTSILTEKGGFIRWTGDGIKDWGYDPFAIFAVSCNGSTGLCNNTDKLPLEEGRIVGDISGSNTTLLNPQSSPVALYFKSLVSNASCNNYILSVKAQDSSSSDLESFRDINITDSNWSTQTITLEPSQKLIIKQNSATAGAISCGKFLGVKFLKHHDLQIAKSGFVKFTMIGGSGSCNINGRIINPDGKASATASEENFYEYDRFTSSSSIDPLNILAVPATLSATPPLQPTMNWSNSVFVRKGQVIRLSPTSWDGTWNAGTTTRKCGIGMAMMIDPRPALLCRGKGDTINNPNCLPDFDGNELIGCRADSPSCSDPSSNAFCSTTCQKPITCTTNGNAANGYTKSGCSIGNTPSGCAYSGSMTQTTCNNCANAMLAQAQMPAQIDLDKKIDVCYNLENFTGKVSDIPSGSTTKSEVDNFLASTKGNGAQKLEKFNGEYGNLQNFENSKKKESNGDFIYDCKDPILATSSGRIRFLILDGENFLGAQNSYTNNSEKLKINPSGILEFRNGQWLEARLCKENSETGTHCKSLKLDGDTVIEPKIVQFPSTATSLTDNLGNYEFDSYGSIFRKTPPSTTNDCDITRQDSKFYCHKDSSTEPENYRLTFKIFDPEVNTCPITTTDADPSNNFKTGVTLKNPFYEKGSGNDGAICSPLQTDQSLKDSGCKKEFYCGNKYANNIGKYTVVVQVKNLEKKVSNIIGAIIAPVIQEMDGQKVDDPLTVKDERVGQVERIYKLLISDLRYQAILKTSLVLMFMFYGLGFLMGVSDLKHSEIFNRIIKIGIIYFFVGESGWYWFNELVIKFFKNGADYLSFLMASSFDNSTELKNAIKDSNFYDKSILFTGVDKVLTIILSDASSKKLCALLFTSIFGWAYLLIILYGFILYVYAIANAVLLYLTAQVFTSILFVLGPIFLLFILFKQTKDMFDNWLKALIGFSLQQIFLLITLAFFNMMMYEVIKMSLGYKVCWDDVWTINIITHITLLSSWTIASNPSSASLQTEVGNIGNVQGIPSLFSILFIWAVASLMQKFISVMTGLASSISGGISASEMGSKIASTVVDLRNKASKAYGGYAQKAWDLTGDKIDQKLFDSGKAAKAERARRRTANANDQRYKAAMHRAGEEAMNKYKKENADKFIGLDKKEQVAKLKEARDEAMKEAGAKFGLQDQKIQSLMNDKGLKLEGYNVVGWAKSALEQKFSEGGTPFTAIKDKNIDPNLSAKQAKEGMKNMDVSTREDFMKKVESGEIGIKKPALDKIMDTAKNPVQNTKMTLSKGKEKIANAIVGAAKKFGNDKEYDKARDQLVSEGAINKMSAGTNWSRNDSEKKMIRERVKENKVASQLEKDGVISRKEAGDNSPRSDVEKQMIREKLKENREEKKSSPIEKASESQIGDLNKQKDKIDKTNPFDSDKKI